MKDKAQQEQFEQRGRPRLARAISIMGIVTTAVVVAFFVSSPFSVAQNSKQPVASQDRAEQEDLSPPSTDPALEAVPWKRRTGQQRTFQSSYEDEFTFKHKRIFNEDPFVWSLSREFAERFGMPKAWIDPDLKGALAVAWRTTTIGQKACGYGRNPKACWPPFTCQMDIYVDSKAPIPWRFDDVERDFIWRGVRSLDYIPRRLPAPARDRYVGNLGLYGSKGQPFLTTAFDSKTSPYSAGGGGISLIYFDRNYAPGITLLGFRGGCPHPRINKDVIFRFFSIEEQRRTRGNIENFAHTIEFSNRFMANISAIYARDLEEHNKRNSARRQIMNRIFPKKK